MSLDYQITFDASDPPALARFWRAALDWVEQPPPEGFESWDDFAAANGMPPEAVDEYGAIIDPGDPTRRILFLKVPESKTAKNRVHLDVNAGGSLDTPPDVRWERMVAHVANLESLGASKLSETEEMGQRWIVMADPEGNEFCVV